MAVNPPLEAAALVPECGPAQVPGPGPIIGKHMRLERLEKNHFPDLWESIGQHEDLWTWWPEGPYSQEEFSTSMAGFKDFMSEDLAVYAVILLSGPRKEQAAGLAMALSEKRTTSRTSELGAFFGPWLQKSRAATECLYVLGEMMFRLNHRRMAWKTNVLNLASRRAAERFGYVQEALIRQEQIVKGRNRDSVFYGIIDSEWPVCKKALEMWLDDGNFDEEGRQRRKLEDIRKDLKKTA